MANACPCQENRPAPQLGSLGQVIWWNHVPLHDCLPPMLRIMDAVLSWKPILTANFCILQGHGICSGSELLFKRLHRSPADSSLLPRFTPRDTEGRLLLGTGPVGQPWAWQFSRQQDQQPGIQREAGGLHPCSSKAPTSRRISFMGRT